jgi:hypothetical protein
MFNTFKKCCGIVAMFALYFYSAPAAFAQCEEGIELTITLEFDNYASEASWDLTSESGEIIASGFGTTAGSETVSACAPNDACYTFTMNDSWGDGGTAYSVADADGNVLASAGAADYTTSISSNFCLGDTDDGDGSDECAANEVTLSLVFDTWAVETGWTLVDGAGSEVAGGAIGSYNGLTEYSEAICLEDGCYSLTILDDYGDGIGAPGSYALTDADGNVLASGGGNFGTSETTEVCVGEIPAVLGCTDAAAENYDPAANEDDGSCVYAGCLDAMACNYSEAATIDDGSCAYETISVLINPDNYASETSWNLTDADGNELASGGSDGAEVCLTSACFTFTIFDSFADGICCVYGIGDYSVLDANGVTLAAGGEFGASESTSFCLPAVPGCTDEASCNYTEGSNIDDGSCDYGCIGCMTVGAANYDPTATQENEGSCVFCEPGTVVLNIDMYDLGGDGWNGAAYYLDSFDGEVSISGTYDDAALNIAGVATDFNCVPLGCYQLTSGGGTADYEIAMAIYDQFGTVYGDQVANNYYGPLPPPAGFPSGGWYIDLGLTATCDFLGCTDENCFNYNISATIDDGSCICPPPNDAIVDAEAVTCGSVVTGNMQNASDVEGVTGAFSGTAVTTGGVWYEFNSDSEQQVFVNTCDTPTNISGLADPILDTKIHVFVYNDAGELEPIVGNDDNCGLLSSVAFVAATGEDYYFYISRWNAGVPGAEFLLTVDCADCDGIPENDLCANATPQLDNIAFTGTNCCASAINYPSVAAPNYAVWFTFNSTDAAGNNFDTFYFDALNVSSGDVTLTIYSGGNCDEITAVAGCIVTGQCAGSVEGLLEMVPNTDYYFAVGTTDPETCGSFEFTTQGIFLGCTDMSADNYSELANQDDGSCEYTIVPENDLCENAIDLPCGEVLEGSMGGATNAGFPSVQCDSTFESPCSDTENSVYISVGGGTWDSEITWTLTDAAGSVFTGAASTGEWLCGVAEGDFLFEGFDSFGDGWNNGSATMYFNGNEVMSLWTFTAGTYDSFSGSAVEDGTTEFPVQHAGVWYSFAGTGELHSINTCGSTIDTRLHVYSAVTASCSDYSCVEQVDGSVAIVETSFDGCGFFDQDDASVSFVSDPALMYYVYVGYDFDGVFNGSGTFQIEMDCQEAIYGCFIDVACNYNPDANIETDDCEYTSCACADNPGGVPLIVNMYDEFGDGWTGSNSGSAGGYEVFDATGASIASGAIDDAMFITDEDNFQGAEFGLDVMCLEPGCYTLDFTGAFVWSEEQSFDVSDGTNTLFSGVGLGSLVVETFEFGLGDVTCGCTEPVACNYDVDATDDNGTCEYETCAGCMDETACDYDETATIEAECCYGSCVVVTMNDSFGDGWSGAVVLITDLEGNTVIEATLADGTFAQETYCLADGCYILSVGDDTWPTEVSWSVAGIFGGIVTGGVAYGPAYISTGGQNCIVGCDVACACNYDDTANILDIDSCVFDDCAGCTYSEAANYDATAGNDDGSCEFDLSNPCPSDINEDGSVTTADLLVFLGAFGSVCE